MADHQITWKATQVASPGLGQPFDVIAAKGVPYVDTPNRFQNFNVYMPNTEGSAKLTGTKFNNLPTSNTIPSSAKIQVRILGGAWRYPETTDPSIEPAVAYAFRDRIEASPLDMVIGINYTLSPFPSHPTEPYDPTKGDSGDPAREGKHPQHAQDVVLALEMLQKRALSNDAYILTAHSCGATLAF